MTTKYTMWIEEIKDENDKVISYKYRKRYKDDQSGKIRSVSANNKKNTKKAQQEMLTILNKKIHENLHTKSSNLTFREVAERWLTIYKGSVKASTATNAERVLRGIESAFGDVLISKITAPLLNDYFENMLIEKKLKRNTVNLSKWTITTVLRYADSKGLVDALPIIDKLTVPMINLSEFNADNYLERHEIKQLIEAMINNGHDQYARLAMLQIQTGMRIGEAVALNFDDDIDLENGLIHITKNYDYKNKVFTTPKTDKSRTIHINQETINLLREQKAFTQRRIIKHGYDRESKFLFMTIRQNPVSYKHYNKTLKADNPLEKRVSSHTFRHTFITLMVENKVNPKLIAQHVGHVDTKMVDEVYTHFTDKMNEELEQVIKDFSVL